MACCIINFQRTCPVFHGLLLLKKFNQIKAEITGYTDNVGQDATNLSLSQQRAYAIYSFLTSKGVPAARLSYAGLGEAKPVASNLTAEGREKNRRVEINISMMSP